MNSMLLILALFGLGAVGLATYVFMVAARNYVSDSNSEYGTLHEKPKDQPFVERSGQDRRRSAEVIDFPLKLSNGNVIVYDRRIAERRKVG